MKIKLFKAITGRHQWYFNITSRNGKIVAASEGYRNRKDAIKTLYALFGAAASLLAQVRAMDETNGSAKS